MLLQKQKKNIKIALIHFGFSQQEFLVVDFLIKAEKMMLESSTNFIPQPLFYCKVRVL